MSVLLIWWMILIFAAGCSVGSFLNVCILRIPVYEKSVFWPTSRCWQCLQPIRAIDQIPLLSYWLLRGRCRTCGKPFSIRLFFIELFTGLCWVGLFYLEVVRNVHNFTIPGFHPALIQAGVIPWQAWVVFVTHAVLLSFLIVASFSDIDHLEIPISVTTTGMAVGLIVSTLFPWPWPWPADPLAMWQFTAPDPLFPGFVIQMPRTGLVPWPVWNSLPDWMPQGSHLAGFVAGLAGLAAGAIPRIVGALYKAGRGQEGMGLGDADLMMMVGAFLGWQPVVIACVVALGPGLFFGMIHLVIAGNKPYPFGPSLALGSVITWLAWERIGPSAAPYFFNAPLLIGFGIIGAVSLFLVSLFLRLVRGPAEPESLPGGLPQGATSPVAPPLHEPAPPHPQPLSPSEQGERGEGAEVTPADGS